MLMMLQSFGKLLEALALLALYSFPVLLAFFLWLRFRIKKSYWYLLVIPVAMITFAVLFCTSTSYFFGLDFSS